MTEHVAPEDRDVWVSASEVGTYMFCPVAYENDKVTHRRVSAEAVRRRRAGTRKHHRHGKLFDAQRVIVRLGVALIAAAVLVLWTMLR